MPGTLFITGATGFLGRELLKRFLVRDPDLKVAALVRGTDRENADRRLRDLLGEVFGAGAAAFAGRTRAVLGDNSLDRLGIDDDEYASLRREVTHVVHGAASVRFDLPLDEARAQNVKGSQGVLDLADAVKATTGRAPRIDYIGTCYVAGDRTDRALESELEKGQGFRNSYEQTKLESERHVRDRQGDLPIAIHRPSIIVGDSRTGQTSSFNVVYWPIRVYALGWWDLLIGNVEAPIDVVPVDWVADAIHYLSGREDSLGGCYHLAAGPEKSVSVGTMAELASRYFKKPPPRVITPDRFWSEIQPEMAKRMKGAMKQLVETGAQYMPYFAQNPLFDVTEQRRALAEAGLEVPDVHRYFTQLFDYCVKTGWGRRPLPAE